MNTEDENKGEIPRRLEGMNKMMKHGTDFFSELARAINLGFDKIGLTFIPKPLRYILCGGFVFSPILAVCYILIFEEDEDIQQARKRIAE